ncbi:hypothetical protein JW905_05615 [bacterium]|nr:hypothetical protein [candidate division CSSED10-310 bacterium]
MSLLDYFKPVDTISPDELRKHMHRHDPADFILLDVRQPAEYERGHLPGAVLMHVSTVAERQWELARDKPVFTYCAVGVRSRAAAAILKDAGFNARSLSGGINAWHGITAAGPPEAGMAYFTPAHGTGELILLAWALEEGSRRFYSTLAKREWDEDTTAVFTKLVEEEEQHKEKLEQFHASIDAGALPVDRLAPGELGAVMEGGMRVEDALRWLDDKNAGMALQLALSLEVDSYDLYLKLERRLEPAVDRRLFQGLARGEKAHIEMLAARLDQRLIE